MMLSNIPFHCINPLTKECMFEEAINEKQRFFRKDLEQSNILF
jgi:hypothetical protein